MIMDKLDLASWYAEHSGQVLLVFAAPVAAAWFLFFESAERQEPIWIIIGAVAAIYYWSKNYLKNYCFNTITSYSKKFSKKPELSQITSEDLMDTIDMEILTKIDEMSEDKGEYIKVIAAVDIIDPEELLERLGKLKSLGYVHSTSRKVSLTNMGIEAFHTTGIQHVALPARFSTLMARAKLWYEEGNYNGVADTINIFFEDILRKFIEDELGDKLNEKWTQLQNENKVRRDFNKVGLGEMLGVCNILKIIQKGSIEDNMIGSFLKLRTPQKHSVNKEQKPQQIAKSTLDLANVFVRERFQR